MTKKISFTPHDLKKIEADPDRDQRFPLGSDNLTFKVSRKGKKTWIWQGWVGGDKGTATITLGSFPLMGLTEARAKAAGLSADRAEGVLTAKLSGRGKAAVAVGGAQDSGMTCQDAWDLYIAALKSGKKKDGSPKNAEKTIYEKQNFWKLWLQEEIGDSVLASVTRDDLEAIVEEIRDSGKDATANTLVAYFQAFFNWSVREGGRKTKLQTNPSQYITKTPQVSRNRYLSDQEIRWLWKALEDENDVWADGYRLALMTGQRKMELFGLRKDEVDVGDKLIDLPASRTKNGLAHIVPVGPLAWAVVERRADAAAEFLFKSLDEEVARPVSGFSKVHARIRKRVEKLAKQDGKTVEAWRLHDLRRTVSTVMNSIRDDQERSLIDPAHVEAVLNHASGKSVVAGTYNRHTYLAEKRRALRIWEERLAKILGLTVVNNDNAEAA